MHYFHQQNIIGNTNSDGCAEGLKKTLFLLKWTCAILALVLIVAAVLTMFHFHAVLEIIVPAILLVPCVGIAIFLHIRLQSVAVPLRYVLDDEWWQVCNVADRNIVLYRATMDSLVWYGTTNDEKYTELKHECTTKSFLNKASIEDCTCLCFDYLGKKTLLHLDCDRDMQAVLKQYWLNMPQA